jgi:CspA family cold shock protein
LNPKYERSVNPSGRKVKGLKGKIKRLIRLRGFGFIRTEDGEEVFFHRSWLQGEDFDALEEGTSVEFKRRRGPKGLRAVNLKVER